MSTATEGGQATEALVERFGLKTLVECCLLLEEGIAADFGLVRAWKGDRHGNLVFNKSSRNFNPLCARAGRVTIAEVEELVEPGDLDPDEVHLPGIYVQRVVPLTPEQAQDKRIEKRTVTAAPTGADGIPEASNGQGN